MKLKKLLSCLLVLSLTICMSGLTTLAAETVVFSDSFETESETGFYASAPVLRSYGENLITNGDFSSTLITSGTGAYFAKTSYSAIAIEDETLKVTNSTITDDRAFNICIPIEYMTAGNVYELEAYVKSDSPYPMKMFLNQTHLGYSGNTYYGMDFLHDNGNRMMFSEASPEWERVVARFSIETTPTADEVEGSVTLPSHYVVLFNIDWNFDGRTSATDPVYIDNIKLRKILNATPSTSAAQTGMPVYSDANLAGKNVQAVMDVMNSTNNDKDVTLITAYYNADLSLNSILNIYKTSVPGNSAVTQRIESPEFAIPASLNGGDIKVFAWDNTSSLVPYIEKTDSEYIGYPIKAERTPAASLQIIENATLAGAPAWRYEDSFANYAGVANSSFTEEIDTATAHSGIASLCIPTDESKASASSSQSSSVWTTVPVKPDTTYRLEFYVMPGYSQGFTFNVGGACGSSPNAKTYCMKGTIDSQFTWDGASTLVGENYAVTANKTLDETGIRYKASNTGASSGWKKVTYTFTTPPANAAANDGVYSKAGTVGEEGSYWTTFGTNISIVFSKSFSSANNENTPKAREYATWIDDVVLYEVTE